MEKSAWKYFQKINKLMKKQIYEENVHEMFSETGPLT